MAQHQIGGIEVDGITARNRNVKGANTSGVFSTPANYGSIAAIRTRLNTINSTYFTEANMDKMSINDLVYALRRLDDPNTF